ncbi:TolC family protein [Pedobacter changchengzhani]|uniref:TolC family protein n=1 Tax=Pedobacter changchengzhani TaxID=2529274 RepID=A0A4R5MJ27_9SPHI|nr:TolC family protein [Pedobacter changchengzhani]TDG35571.1 TolC family protein [Pedobacter changchengzhani]
MLVYIQNLKFNYLIIIVISLFCVPNVQAQQTVAFKNLQEVLTLAKTKNYTFINANIQNKLAELTKKTALGNVFNPRIPASMQLLDNTKQQVLFLPGEIFGQPGTFRQVTTGQKYSSLINLQPQFELFNLAGIAQIKSAKINQQLTENQNKLNEQNIYNQINTIYFNILSFKAQIEIISQNLASADTILQITQNRFKESVGRKQNVNEAEVNQINLKNNLEQLSINLKIQEESLALFFENSIYPTLTEKVWAYENTMDVLPIKNSLVDKNASLQLQMMQQDIRFAKAQNWPTLSFISSLNWQNLSRDFFYDTNSNTISYNYIGLKLSMNLPTTVTKLANIKNKQFEASILKTNAEHSIKETETKNRALILDYEKAVIQLQNFKKIASLKADTYHKNFNQYQENILSLDDLLISYNNMLNAKLNVVSALANIGFNKSKIDINNKF